jgi:hypothetical protein
MSPSPEINNGFRHQRTVATNTGDAASMNHLMKTEHFVVDNR